MLLVATQETNTKWSGKRGNRYNAVLSMRQCATNENVWWVHCNTGKIYVVTRDSLTVGCSSIALPSAATHAFQFATCDASPRSAILIEKHITAHSYLNPATVHCIFVKSLQLYTTLDSHPRQVLLAALLKNATQGKEGAFHASGFLRSRCWR